VGQLIVLLYQAALIVLVLLYIRHLVHHSLMEEGQEMDVRPIVCPHCHHHVLAAGFCPSCGAALDASPRRETGLLPTQPAPAVTSESQ
jgi:predicted amidophosphoribosyltransferase